MFIACKLLYEKMNIMLFCREYWQITHKGSICPPISEESRKQITENIFKIECDVLNTINFKLDLDFAFPHKVALFVRGQGLQSKSLTYHTISTDDAKHES
jgi:hypothetical protein